jgi:transcriptional regulator with XRE-family HTH domain
VSDLSKLKKFLDAPYRESYLDSHVRGSIAYQIRALREKLSLNQTEFGALVGMPQSVISRLEDTEQGAVNISTLLRIANHLGIALNVRFSDFETILKADVSPAAFQVENINDTITRLTTAPTKSAAKPVTVTNAIAMVVVVNQSSTGGGSAWPKPTPNQPSLWGVFPGSGTSNTERSTAMAV